MHPANPQIIYYGGNAGIYRSTNRGTNWSLVSNAVTGARTLVIAPSDGNILYASSGSTLRKSTDGGTTWATISTGLPALTITSVAVSSASSQTLWVTFSGYTAASKVYKTTNSGTTWTNVTNSLPNIPANCIVYQNGSADYVYVGTDLGVFYRSGAMGDWAVFDTGLPNVIVNDLDIQYSTGRIRAATYGRGLWESDLVDGSTTPGLTLIAPNGGESWAPNTVQSILWSAPATVTNVKLEYSTNGGSSWTTVISSVSAAAGTHSWTVPAFQTAQALVRITSTTDASVTDNSNAAFTIAPCTPTYINACNSEDFINLVTFNTIAKVNSGCNGQANNYIFYSSDQTTIEKGQTYTISLQSGPTWEQFFAVWIDFNQNTTFEDAERVVLTNTRTISVVNVQIPIPMTAATGATRMRVRCRYDGAPANSCSQYEYGETEDYPITIVAPTPTTLTVKALLQGVWNEATQTQTLTPIGIELRSGGVDSTDNPSPISWSLTGTTLVARASGFCDAAGNVTVNFDNLPTGSYWIVVRHGGHLGVASRRRVSITAGGTVTYDFTDSGFKAFTKSSTVTSASGATTQGGDGKWVLRSGDLLLAAPSGVNANDYSPVTGNNGKTSFVPAP
jgi:hypothetical protein